MKYKTYTFFFLQKMSQVFHFHPLPVCLGLASLPPPRPAWRAEAGGRMPLSLRIWNKMSASFYPHLFIAGDVRSRTKVGLISGPGCRHLWAISGTLLPNSPILWWGISPFFLHSWAFLNVPFNTPLGSSHHWKGFACHSGRSSWLSNQGDIGIIEMCLCLWIYYFHDTIHLNILFTLRFLFCFIIS